MKHRIGIRSHSFRQHLLTTAAAVLALPGWSGSGVNTNVTYSTVIPVDVSGEFILVSDGAGKGLDLVNAATGDAADISEQNTASYGATLSPDGKTVCYKSFNMGQQSPTLYDIATKTRRVLATANQAGTPAVAADGTIAYTVENQLYVMAPDSGKPESFDLGHYVNLIAISPDGSKVAFNDANDQIVILDLVNGQREALTEGEHVYFAPAFSPNGKKLLARTLTGQVVTINLKTGKTHNLGSGDAPGWLDNNSVALTRRSVIEGVGVEKTTLLSVNVAGKTKGILSETAGDAFAAAGDGNFAVTDAAGSNSVVRHGLVHDDTAFAAPIDVENEPAPLETKEIRTFTGSSDTMTAMNVVDGPSTVQLNNVPYIHQNNDTPNWWNGNWSCNATAAIMGIQYYNILPKHPITANWPTPHTSDYGWYIPNVYSRGGQTFNIGSYDPNGTLGYGGYGYITQNGWEDTKGHMADFISYHGPTSSVDWSPTFAEAKTEINNNHPFVLLTSITSSGHYPLCIGYVKNQHTLIFNDPYGNKNSGSYPSPNGQNVRYDWPGYNNGYSNLVTVHCHIFCRFGQPSAPTSVAAAAVSTSKINLTWTDNSYCEANYDVFRGTTAGGPYSKIATLGANAESYSNTGLASNTRYYYRVRARNASGSSPYSNEATAKTAAGGATTITVDNTSGDFSASSNWVTSSYAGDKYGTNYRFRPTEAISDSATWTFDVAIAGNYSIQAWWSAGTNRSPAATYILPDSSTVSKNQQANGGSWQALDIQYLSAGTHTVKLSCWAASGYVVIADAVRIVPQ